MRTLLLIAGFGNFIDTIATVYLASIGYVETSPVMAQLLQCPAVFTAVKIASMTWLLVFLWRNRADRHAKPMAILAAVVYGLIAVYYGAIFIARYNLIL